jgi:hypothetical protein
MSPRSQLEDFMKLTLSFLTIFCLGIFLTAAAHADTFTYAWESPVGLGAGPGSGTLTATTDVTIPNALDVTSITGTVGGTTITGLLACAAYDPNHPCSSSGNSFFYDNLLYPEGTGISGLTVVDFRGIGFALGNSGLEGDYFASSSHIVSFITNQPHDNGEPAGFSITSIPEPGGLFLLGTGLLGMTGAVRRRMKSRGDLNGQTSRAERLGWHERKRASAAKAAIPEKRFGTAKAVPLSKT